LLRHRRWYFRSDTLWLRAHCGQLPKVLETIARCDAGRQRRSQEERQLWLATGKGRLMAVLVRMSTTLAAKLLRCQTALTEAAGIGTGLPS
jgi:hypothetical protein